MISALVLVVGYQSSVFTQAVDRAARSLEAMKSGSIRMEVETNVNRKSTVTSSLISFKRPDILLIRLKEPIQGEMDATDRSYRIQGSSMVAYDHTWNEVLRRKDVPKGSFSERATNAIGNLGEPFSCALSGTALRQVLSQFSSLGEWSMKSIASGSSITTFNSKTKARLLLSFDTLGRLTRVSLAQTASYSNWTYAYSASEQTDLSVPTTAKIVGQFTARPAPPQFIDADAKSVFLGSLRTYDRLNRYKLNIEGTSGNSSLWVSGRNLRGEDQAKTWSYRSGQCAIIDRSTNRFYSGKVSAADLIDALGNLKLSVASWPRWALLNNNPLQSMFNSGFTIRSAGNLRIGGLDTQILQVSSKQWSGSIQINSQTKLLTSITVKPLDFSGKVISVSTQTLKYTGIGSPIPVSVFQLGPPKGAKSATIKSLIVGKQEGRLASCRQVVSRLSASC